MKLKKAYNKIKNNHALMMIACCSIPLVLLAVIYLFGISNSFLSLFIILLCPLMHFWMMKHMGEHVHQEEAK